MENKLQIPSEVLDATDVGDELHRNLRYQHACGVILIIDSIIGTKPYTAIWCEHHDDILCERSDGVFDSYQIKTKKPENGAWKMTDDEIKNSIKKFVHQDKTFPAKMSDFHFVSNAEFLNSAEKKNLGKCPVAFVNDLKKAQLNGGDLSSETQATFDALKTHCDCDEEALISVITRLAFINGPERKSFDSAIAHDFLPKIPECSGMLPHELNSIRDGLIGRVAKAASLATDDAGKYWICHNLPDSENALLISKKVDVAGVLLDLQDNEFRVPIRLDSPTITPNLIGNISDLGILQKKLIFAGLSEQLDTARSRTIAAERRLLELVDKLGKEEFDRRIGQIETFVKGACDDAKVLSEADSPPFRSAMYRAAMKEIKATADNRPTMVYREPYEFLMGMAGLLTEDCQVWWSEEFDLGAVK